MSPLNVEGRALAWHWREGRQHGARGRVHTALPRKTSSYSQAFFLPCYRTISGFSPLSVSLRFLSNRRPGYQANMALFMAATNFTLGDCLTWPETDALSQQQAAYIRVRAHQHALLVALESNRTAQDNNRECEG